ncbi:MAG TPA: ion channel [Solirubrobacterales bacterium]|nr:ion channel [Solirubrobacterales bacterium]
MAELAGMNRDRWRQRAQSASDAFGLVLALVLTTYVLASVISNRGWPAVLLTLATGATAVVALTSSHVRSLVVRRALGLAVLAVLLSAVSAVTGGRPWLSAASVIEMGLLAVAMGAVLRRVVTSANVSSRTILGAISVYASLGILFTWTYGLIDRIEGGGFFGTGVAAKGSDLLFFSYTTLTTTGYGDLVPAGQVGRMVSGLEMMLGQIFLVTLVAGLVSLWRPGEGLLRRRAKRSGEAP